MIGVISKASQKPTVEEFFQLFKVPWEFYDREKSYDVVIVTDNTIAVPSARLLIIFGSETSLFDIEDGIHIYKHTSGILLEYGNFQFPIYKDLSIFQYVNSPFIKVKGKYELGGIEYIYSGQRILRIGYDLFDEIAFLLSRGQPIEYAHIPTVEIHISMLRNWILDSGLPLIEVPPVPHGYNFIACLTHDVDFMSIRDHRLDHSVIGFILRVLFPSSIRDVRNKLAWSKFIKNWKALLSLPGVYLGLCRDFWFDIDRYIGIEKEMSSTFFFIPFKDYPGEAIKDKAEKYRAARYNLNDYKTIIEDLIKQGHEIGLHGIDAWYDHWKGFQEFEIIRQITGEDNVGVRMHWLYFSEDSPETLEKAGFFYDSTFGYNDAIGYRSGTTQVFLLPRSTKVFELPLHIMDTTLFSQKRMGLSESKALQLCKDLMSKVHTYGGVITINWHTRSLNPERNWDDFYFELLKIMKSEKVWFATARQAVNWFKMRRSIHFDEVHFLRNKVQVKLNSNNDNCSPACLLRVHIPDNNASLNKDHHNSKQTYIDIPLSGESAIEVAL